jgi:hypothetical protein
MNYEVRNMCKEEAAVYLQVLLQNLGGGTKEITKYPNPDIQSPM